MRILLASEPGGGGVGRHVIDLAGGLRAEGHDVEIAFAPARAEPWFTDALHALRVPLHATRMRRSTGSHDVHALRELRRIVHAARPFDIVHGHSSKAGALLRAAAPGSPARRLYTPHALVTMSPDLPPAARLVYSLAERMLAPLAHAIICVSQEEREHARRLGIAARRLYVVNNGVGRLPEAERHSMRQRMRIPDDAVCAGFVGRLAPQKAAHRVIEALAAASRKCGQLYLVIVGDGDQRNELDTLCRALGIANRVRFMNAPDGAALMAGFDLFVLGSRYEAFPYVFLEAATRGLPIVTTDVGGAAAVVAHGRNGYIVPQDKLPAFAEHLAAIGNDADLRRRMGEASLAIGARFTLERMVQQTVAVYREVLGGPATLKTRGTTRADRRASRVQR